MRGVTIHVIVAGVNVGAQSYWNAEATMLMHTRGVLIMTQDASMLLTGRRALEAAGSVSAEDEEAIGGYERIMGPNGEAQYQARNLAEAYRILYEHYRFDYIEPGERAPRRLESADPEDRSICDFEIVDDEFGFATVGEIFDDLDRDKSGFITFREMYRFLMQEENAVAIKDENKPAAQAALLARAKANSEATYGKYVPGSCVSIGSKGNVEMQGGAY